MPFKPHRPVGGLPGPAQPSGDTATAKQPVGRPKGVPSMIVNVRLPLPLVAALDRYLDRIGFFIFRLPEALITPGRGRWMRISR